MMVRQGVSEQMPLESRAKRGEAASHAEIWVKALQIEGRPRERVANVEGQVNGQGE